MHLHTVRRVVCVSIVLLACSPAWAAKIDNKLRKRLDRAGVTALDPAPTVSPEMFTLGQALFFDWILSGNRDIACATCHHPALVTGDALALPVGTGSSTIGKIGLARVRGEGREFIPRNAPEIFNRGSVHWRSQFWDSRVEEAADGTLLTPAGNDLPEGLNGVLAAQAMFPVTSRDEMRGAEDEDELLLNELSLIANNDLHGIWEALMVRLSDPANGYRDLFQEAFGASVDDLGFEAAANAIAAFEAAAFHFDDSPFDEYLRGDDSAMSMSQKRGALLFYGKAKCANCHSGTLLTDQKHYNLAVPPLGPGKDPVTHRDLGRFAITGDLNDLYRFRTPPLRNVAETAPYMHSGAFLTLRDAVLHHLDVEESILNYDPDEQLEQAELRETVLQDVEAVEEMLDDLDKTKRNLRDDDLEDLLNFLHALTAPNLQERLDLTVPASVPSGLDIDLP